jgi:hypothetical protein
MKAIARDYENITPNDGTTQKWNVLFVGTGGHVVVENLAGNEVYFKNIGNGESWGIAFQKLKATGAVVNTTAQDFVGLDFPNP